MNWLNTLFYVRRSSKLLSFNRLFTTSIFILLLYTINANPSLAGQPHWLDEIEQHYLAGNWTMIETILNANQPVNDLERAGHYYYRARIALESEEIIPLLEEAVNIAPDLIYGQRALVELANLYSLERNYNKSLDYLLQLSPQLISERDYLLASVYLKMERYPEAIRAAQDFIAITKDSIKRELAYMIIVEAYLLNNQFNLALMNLETMRNQDFIKNHHASVDYKEAYCLEMIGERTRAVNKYNQVITGYPYSEYAFRAEKRLYEVLLTTPEYKSTEVTTPSALNYYVQVNAFSVERNANSHSEHLRGLGFENRIIKTIRADQTMYLVAVGPFGTEEAARSMQQDIKNNLNLDSFIIRH